MSAAQPGAHLTGLAVVSWGRVRHAPPGIGLLAPPGIPRMVQTRHQRAGPRAQPEGGRVLEEVLVATIGAPEGRTAVTARGGTVARLATARTQPGKGGDLLVVE